MTFQRILAAAVATLVLSAPLSAQRVTPNAFTPVTEHAAVTVVAVTDSTSSVVAAAPVSMVSTERTFYTGTRMISETSPLPAPANSSGHGGRNGAMMIVGAAALVVGSVIGGDAGTLMMVGGGVVGLVGLWRYLQ